MGMATRLGLSQTAFVAPVGSFPGECRGCNARTTSRKILSIGRDASRTAGTIADNNLIGREVTKLSAPG